MTASLKALWAVPSLLCPLSIKVPQLLTIHKMFGQSQGSVVTQCTYRWTGWHTNWFIHLLTCKLQQTKDFCAFSSLQQQQQQLHSFFAHSRYFIVVGDVLCSPDSPFPLDQMLVADCSQLSHPRNSPDWRELSDPRFHALSRGIKTQPSCWRAIQALEFPVELTKVNKALLWLQCSSTLPSVQSYILPCPLLIPKDPINILPISKSISWGFQSSFHGDPWNVRHQW